jgi:2,3-bisphosphoglycerate-dependent phosphoglycerate mutase
MAHLVLVRHGLSEWNKLSKWTGLTDISITEEGAAQARATGEALKHMHFDKAYVSNLKRAQETLAHIKDVLGLDVDDLPTEVCSALNERDYGIYTGKNKLEVQKEVGEEVYQKIRRSWDHPIPGGESLKDVFHRVVPCYEEMITKDLAEGKNILVVAHGNSLRALAKHLEKISDEDIANFNIGVAEARCYEFDKDGEICDITVKNKTAAP